MNLGWLVPIINHPGVPWGAGGLIGGVIGFLIGQPDCSTFPCTPAELPIVGAVATEASIAIMTVLGAIGGYLLKLTQG